MFKRNAIIIAVLIVSFVFWIAVRPWISDPTWSTVDWHTWLWPLILLMITGAVIATALALLDTWYWRYGVTAIVGLMFLAAFNVTLLNLLAVLILFLFHSWAMRAMKNAIHNHIKVDFRAGILSGMRNVITPMLIMLSFVYFANPEVQDSARQNKLPPAITKAVETASRIITRTSFADIPDNQQSQVENQLNREVIDVLNRQSKPYRRYFPPILAFGLFIVLQGLSFVFVPIAGYLAWGLFKILQSTRFVTVTKKDVEAEVLQL